MIKKKTILRKKYCKSGQKNECLTEKNYHVKYTRP